MNRKFRIGTMILAVIVLCVVLLSGCGSGGNEKTQKKQTVVAQPKDNTQAIQDVKQAQKIFNALPSPLESAMLMKSAGAKFDRKFLNPVENAKNYTTQRSQALNLGIYTCDLSFASLYDETQLIIDYMAAAKKMADGLGILDAISKSTQDELSDNINNTEVVMKIVSETFLNSNSYLADNDQPALASIILVGGWMEGLYIATQLVDEKEFNGNKLVGRIIDQKLSIEVLQNLLNSNKENPAVGVLITQIDKLKTVFDKIKIETKPIKTEIDKTTNTTILKSEVTTDMSLAIFKELTGVVAEIRGSFVK
jgi:outer membrane murein-binding lipoprotein Lpp